MHNGIDFLVVGLTLSAALVAGSEAGSTLKSHGMAFSELFDVVNGAVIIAIMGITTAIRAVGGDAWKRWVPLVPMVLGLASGYLVSADSMSAKQVLTWAMLYSGAACLGYMIIWPIVLRRIENAQDKKL